VVASLRLVRTARGGDLLRPAVAAAGVPGPPGRLTCPGHGSCRGPVPRRPAARRVAVHRHVAGLPAGGSGVPREPHQEVPGALIPGLHAPRRCPGESTPTQPAGVEAGYRPCGVHVEACYRRRWMVSCGITVGAGATGLVGLLTSRRGPQADAARAMIPPGSRSPRSTELARAAQPLPKAWPVHALPAEFPRELPAEEIAAILRRQDQP